MAGATGTKKGGKAKPVTAHPLFPALVALWFGALLGLGSLAMGGPNLERVVMALQIPRLLHAAAPPLGVTARALIAVGLTGLGAIIGYGLARVLARPKSMAKSMAKAKPAAPPPVAVRARDVHPDAPIRRPIFAHEELGESDEAADRAAALDMQSLRASLANVAEEPASEDGFGLPAFLAESDLVTLESEPEPETPPPAAPAESAPSAFGIPLGEAARRISSDELDDLSPVELLERLAMAMQRRLDRRAQAGADTPGSPPDFSAPPASAEPDETEKALRDALAALQRMTGTG